MKVKLKSGTKIWIPKNENNKGFPPVGRFQNTPMIKHNDFWYMCSLRFNNGKITINNLYRTEENSNTIIEMLKDFNHEEEIGNFKKDLILFLMNSHKLNSKIFRLKTGLFERRKTIFVFLLAIALSGVYYFVNVYTQNGLLKWFSENLFAQTIMIFLTLSSFINIFTPFTIQKEITQKDIEQKAAKVVEEKKRLDEEYERAKRDATI